MTISERINKKFNSHGTTIEESIKNAKVSGGGYSVEKTEVTLVDLTGQKDNWNYNSEANISEFELSGVTFDDTMETLNVTLDGETKTFVRTTDQIEGNAAWVYPETFETRPDMAIMYDSDTSTYGLAVYTGEVSYDSVKIVGPKETITVEDDFKKAVNVADGVMVVNKDYDESLDTDVLEKTWQEIYDALDSGVVVFVKPMPWDNVITMELITKVSHEENNKYSCCTLTLNGDREASSYYYVSNSANDYPVLTVG